MEKLELLKLYDLEMQKKGDNTHDPECADDCYADCFTGGYRRKGNGNSYPVCNSQNTTKY